MSEYETLQRQYKEHLETNDQIQEQMENKIIELETKVRNLQVENTLTKLQLKNAVKKLAAIGL